MGNSSGDANTIHVEKSCSTSITSLDSHLHIQLPQIIDVIEKQCAKLVSLTRWLLEEMLYVVFHLCRCLWCLWTSENA